MPSTSSTTPVLSSSGVSQPDNAGVTAKESDTDRVLLSMKFCFSAPPLTLFTLQWAYTMLLSPPPSKNSGSDPGMLTKFVSIGRYSPEVRTFGTIITSTKVFSLIISKTL